MFDFVAKQMGERPKASLALLGLAQPDLASCVYQLQRRSLAHLLARLPLSLLPSLLMG